MTLPPLSAAELEARLDPEEGAVRVHNFLSSMVMEMTVIAKSCGKGNVHNLEPEDLRAVSLEASAFTGVPLAGVDWVVGPELFGGQAPGLEQGRYTEVI